MLIRQLLSVICAENLGYWHPALLDYYVNLLRVTKNGEFEVKSDDVKKLLGKRAVEN
jgi:hypothetical protein